MLAGGVMDACRGVRDLLVLSTLEGLHVILDGVQRAQHKVEDHYVDDEVWRQLPNHLNRGDGQGGGSGDGVCGGEAVRRSAYHCRCRAIAELQHRQQRFGIVRRL